jgi:hypothetical protein
MALIYNVTDTDMYKSLRYAFVKQSRRAPGSVCARMWTQG